LRPEESALVLGSGAAHSTSENLARLYDDVLNGRVHPAKGTVLLNITKLQIDLDEKTSISKLEQRLEDLNRLIALRDIESAKPKDPFSDDTEDSSPDDEDEQQ
jgi:hypothetical protein